MTTTKAPTRRFFIARKPSFIPINRPVDQKGDSPSKPKGTVPFLIPIGTRTAWLARLQAHGLTLRGHRLVKARPVKEALA